MEIEDIAQGRPESILQCQIEPAVGMQPFQARELAFGLGLNIKQVSRAVTAIIGCYRAFRDLDATMVEINPLVVTQVTIACWRWMPRCPLTTTPCFAIPPWPRCAIRQQEDPRESTGGQIGLNYVGLSGDIGCIINGAGLAMATMDMIKYAGGEPANFLDVGGGASPERVARRSSGAV